MPKVCSNGKCKRLAEGKYKWCQGCRHSAKKSQKKRKEKLAKATARDGYKYCKNCCREFPLMTHFTSSHSRRKTLTSYCVSCRASQNKSQRKKTTKRGKCRKLFENWKKDKSCELCGYKGNNMEADHRRGQKIHDCGDYAWWAYHGGASALEAELENKCRPLCTFCHRLVSQQERGVLKNPSLIKKKLYVNAIKLKIGECQVCKRQVLEEQCCAFDFDHIDAKLKQEGIGKMVNSYSLKRFKQYIDLEIAKCRLICCMCHRDHTRKQWKEKTAVVQELALSI